MDSDRDRRDSGDGDPLKEQRALGSMDGVTAGPGSPWTWTAPLLALGRTEVRIHGSLLALALLQVLRVQLPGPSGPVPDAIAPMLVVLVTLVWLALLQDGVREWVSRASGAEAGGIALWPAGGISWREPPGSWTSRLAAAAAGPVSGITLASLLGMALIWRTGRWDIALPMPLSVEGLDQLAGDRAWSTVYLVQWTNLALTAASLIPAHPFAGGRIVAASLEPWLERDGAVRATLVLGAAVGIVAIITGLATGSMLLLLAGAVAVGTSDRGCRALALSGHERGLGAWRMIVGDAGRSSASRRQRRNARQQASDDAAIDAILQKVSDRGMAALSQEERRTLERVTARRRREGREGGMP